MITKKNRIKNSYKKTSFKKKKRGVKRQYSHDAPLYKKPNERKKEEKLAKENCLKIEKIKNKSIDNNNNNHQKSNMYPEFYILKHIDDFDYKIEGHDCGRRNVTCQKCKSQMWLEERLSKSSAKNNIFGMCCMNGDIEIPLLQSPPYELKALLKENDDQSKFFRKNI